jgi:DMSO/TMAO reductase YedYZ molybdopterin-dependent catalytic subunit
MTFGQGVHPRYSAFICLLFPGMLALLAPVFSWTPISANAQSTLQSVPQASAASAELKIGGAVSTPLMLTVADLKKMPRKTLSVVNPHDKKTENYEGVLLEDLLRRAGGTQGEQLRGAAMTSDVVAEAGDGYRVVFSLAELDSGIQDSDVIVADTMDGAPLGEKFGPFRLVAPHEKRPARWVRMLRSLTVLRAAP